MTLTRCQHMGSGFQSVRGRGTTYSESYWPEVVCPGAWFVEPVAFDALHVHFSSLEAWSTESGFDPQWQNLSPEEGKTVAKKFTRPPTRHARLEDGTMIKLTFPLDEKVLGLPTFKKTLTQATQFVF